MAGVVLLERLVLLALVLTVLVTGLGFSEGFGAQTRDDCDLDTNFTVVLRPRGGERIVGASNPRNLRPPVAAIYRGAVEGQRRDDLIVIVRARELDGDTIAGCGDWTGRHAPTTIEHERRALTTTVLTCSVKGGWQIDTAASTTRSFKPGTSEIWLSSATDRVVTARVSRARSELR